jgi:hypothetical protein
MTESLEPTSSIDGTIAAMDRHIDHCLRASDRGVFFAAMYRAVTERVRQGIHQDWFDDGARMERFDVLFARRYLDACRGWEAGTGVTGAWRLAFETAERHDCIALQHVLLGINAHINLDLGIAAADAAPGNEIRELRDDFERINDLLAEMVDSMQDALAAISPWSRLVDRVGLRFDEALVSHTLRQTRAEAWEFAVALSGTEPGERAIVIERRDQEVTGFGRRIADPAGSLRWAVATARLRERDDLAAVVDHLSRSAN